jgi:undecaprenyl diphosphate synthase
MADIILTNFTPEERAILERLDLQRIPRHIAIIMDGNGRWAHQQGLPRVVGHRAGVESVRSVITACGNLGIDYLTLYSFSTENWERPGDEVHALMELIEQQLRTEIDALHAQGMRVRHLGRREGLPASLQEILHEASERTTGNAGLQIIFAINYSGRTEIIDAARRLVADRVDPASLGEDDIKRVLYLPDVPDPDLLIRSGGEMRVSNFLLWEIAYTEFWVSPLLWPDFRAVHLLEAIEEYQHRQRKFGRIGP